MDGNDFPVHNHNVVNGVTISNHKSSVVINVKMDYKSIAGKVVFDVCRCLGTCPFDRSGKFSKPLSVPFIIIILSSFICILTLWAHYDDADFSKASWSNLTEEKFAYKLKVNLAFIIQVPLVAPGLIQIYECIVNKHKFHSAFRHLKPPKLNELIENSSLAQFYISWDF